MEYTELSMIKGENIFINDQGLHIKLKTETLKGYSLLLEISEKIKRPVDSHGNIVGNIAYCWITIPLTSITKVHGFGNEVIFKKKKKK